MRAFVVALLLLFAAESQAASDPVGTWAVNLSGPFASGAGYLTFNDDKSVDGYAILRPAKLVVNLNAGFFLLSGTWDNDPNGNLVGIISGTPIQDPDPDNPDPALTCGPTDANFSASFKGTASVTKKQFKKLQLTMNSNDGIISVNGQDATALPPIDIAADWQATLTIISASTTASTAAAEQIGVGRILRVAQLAGTRATTTKVELTTSILHAGQSTTATATVTDSDTGTATTPTGTVTFSSSDSGDKIASNPCTLGASGTCAVTVTVSSITGAHTITAHYDSDAGHASSSGTATLTVQPSVIQTKTFEFLTIGDPSGFGDPTLQLDSFFKVDGTGPAYSVTGCALITRDGKVFMVSTENAGDTTRFVSGKLNKTHNSASITGFDDDQSSPRTVKGTLRKP